MSTPNILVELPENSEIQTIGFIAEKMNYSVGTIQKRIEKYKIEPKGLLLNKNKFCTSLYDLEEVYATEQKEADGANLDEKYITLQEIHGFLEEICQDTLNKQYGTRGFLDIVGIKPVGKFQRNTLYFNRKQVTDMLAALPAFKAKFHGKQSRETSQE